MLTTCEAARGEYGGEGIRPFTHFAEPMQPPLATAHWQSARARAAEQAAAAAAAAATEATAAGERERERETNGRREEGACTAETAGTVL